MTTDNTHNTTNTAAANEPVDTQSGLRWAGTHVTLQNSEQISNRPWGETHRITHADGIAYLKILPISLESAPRSTPHLANIFPDTIPTVIAADVENRYLLLADHQGKEFKKQPNEKERVELLEAYACIQAQSANDIELKRITKSVSVSTLVEQLIAFLTPGETHNGIKDAVVGADFFMSSSRCQTYAKLLVERASLLNGYLQRTSALPDTINHCDLRYRNAAQGSNNTTILYDWDEAVIGPAGLSLHAMFSGCSALFPVLHPSVNSGTPEKLRKIRRELDAYLTKLAANGYADKKELHHAIGASALAGMLHYIIGYSRFPKDSSNYKRSVRRNLKKRLTDLLDVCDFLTISENADVMHLAHDYASAGRSDRAEALLKEHTRRHPEDASALFRLGNLLRKNRQLAQSIDVYRAALDLAPDNTDVHQKLGKSLAQTGELNQAMMHLRRAHSNDSSRESKRFLRRINSLIQARDEADKPGILPTVRLSSREKRNGTIEPESLQLCNSLFRQHGTLLLKNVFDQDLLRRCHDTFVDRYRAYLKDTTHSDALRIGDKRFQVTIDMQAPYNSPELYGSGLIVPLMQQLIGKNCILGCFTSSMSLPGSEDQRLHKDHKDLFFDDQDACEIPSFAVTVMVPLVDIDEIVGTTRVKKGTHKMTSRQSEVEPYQTPIASLGDCYLMDYRLSHHGQANRSDKPRPILSMVYQRPWFRDYINFNNQPSLRISRTEYKKLPVNLKPLLAWTNEPGPR